MPVAVAAALHAAQEAKAKQEAEAARRQREAEAAKQREAAAGRAGGGSGSGGGAAAAAEEAAAKWSHLSQAEKNEKLYWAACNGNEDEVRSLLAAGADPEGYKVSEPVSQSVSDR